MNSEAMSSDFLAFIIFVITLNLTGIVAFALLVKDDKVSIWTRPAILAVSIYVLDKGVFPPSFELFEIFRQRDYTSGNAAPGVFHEYVLNEAFHALVVLYYALAAFLLLLWGEGAWRKAKQWSDKYVAKREAKAASGADAKPDQPPGGATRALRPEERPEQPEAKGPSSSEARDQ